MEVKSFTVRNGFSKWRSLFVSFCIHVRSISNQQFGNIRKIYTNQPKIIQRRSERSKSLKIIISPLPAVSWSGVCSDPYLVALTFAFFSINNFAIFSFPNWKIEFEPKFWYHEMRLFNQNGSKTDSVGYTFLDSQMQWSNSINVLQIHISIILDQQVCNIVVS